MAEKKPFRTILDPSPIIYTNPGSEEEEIWALRLTDTGEEEFYVKGKTNVYQKIQMFKDDCDLEKILMKCTQSGDLSLLNQRDPFFMDMEDFPDNIFEAHRKIKDAEQAFNELPLETRKAYGNSFDRFLSDFGSENWMRNMGMLKEKDAEKTEIEEGEKEKE